jgi:uncharacterized Zn finger protein
VTKAHKEEHDDRPEVLADKADHLAGEVKSLAINLAIVLAKVQGRQKTLGKLEQQFTELIRKANDTSQQVIDALETFKVHKRMISGLPASTGIIEQRGAYDSIEAKLNHVYKLSREIMETIGRINNQEQVG